jgi:hypothetical protein
MPSLTSYLSAAALALSVSAAPVKQHPIKHNSADADKDHYAYKNDPWDRKHDTYGDHVQPYPRVSLSCRCEDVEGLSKDIKRLRRAMRCSRAEGKR